MNTKPTKLLINAAAVTALAMMPFARPADAVPINGQYVEDSRCDNVSTQFLSHELGESGFFPINEEFKVVVAPTQQTVCVANDGLPNDWIVQITNTSGTAWKNLFFVCDAGMTVGNADGSIRDVANAPNVLTDAFRIDGTVTITGANDNLLGESGIVNEIFEPGETWRFNVSNFGGLAGTPPVPPIFETPGKFAGSDPVLAPQTNSASILAVPVPEPTSLGIFGMVAAALLMRRRRKA